MAVFRIERFGPSAATADAMRGRIRTLLRPAGRRRKGPSARAIRIIEMALVAALGALIAWTFYLAAGPSAAPPPAPPPRAASDAPATSSPVNPFRTAAAPAAAPTEAGPELAETTLNLTLHGTWIDAKGGTAIIRAGDADQERYSAGDAITDGVTLDTVYRDQVVIVRNGVRESLRLINRDGGAVVGGAAAPSFTSFSPSASELSSAGEAGGLAAIGQHIVAMPETDEVGGVRLVLQPAGDQQAFSQLGLQPGDAVVAVDNQPIGRDIAHGLETLAMSAGKESVTISVERDGVVMPVVVGLQSTTAVPPVGQEATE